MPLSLSTFVISTEPLSTNSFSTFSDKTSVIPFLISNDTGFASFLYPGKLSTSTSLYFPTDRSETFAFPSLSVVTFVTTLSFSSCTSNITPANTAPLSLSTFVISTEPLSNSSFSTFNDKTFVIPFLISNDTGSVNCL